MLTSFTWTRNVDPIWSVKLSARLVILGELGIADKQG